MGSERPAGSDGEGPFRAFRFDRRRGRRNDRGRRRYRGHDRVRRKPRHFVHHGAGADVAARTIRMDLQPGIVRVLFALRLVLMRVMTKVRGSRGLLVRAIRSGDCPGVLKWQCKHQQEDEEAFHRAAIIGLRKGQCNETNCLIKNLTEMHSLRHVKI
jgi:hypothetical protein